MSVMFQMFLPFGCLTLLTVDISIYQNAELQYNISLHPNQYNQVSSRIRNTIVLWTQWT